VCQLYVVLVVGVGGIFQEASLNRTDKENRGGEKEKESPGDISEESAEKFLSRTRAERRALLRVRLFLENQKMTEGKSPKENKPPVSDPCPVVNASKYPPPDPAMWCCGR